MLIFTQYVKDDYEARTIENMIGAIPLEKVIESRGKNVDYFNNKITKYIPWAVHVLL